MHNIEDHHNTQHQNSIKDVQKPLVAEYIPVISLDELRDSEHRPDQDEDAGSVESDEMLAPWDEFRNGLWSGCFADAGLEEDGDEEEAAEEDDLDEEPADDEVLAGLES